VLADYGICCSLVICSLLNIVTHNDCVPCMLCSSLVHLVVKSCFTVLIRVCLRLVLS